MHTLPLQGAAETGSDSQTCRTRELSANKVCIAHNIIAAGTF